MSADNKRDWHFSVKLTDAERQLLAQFAEQRGTSAGSIVRWAIRKLLQEEGITVAAEAQKG